jgi:hypothetical protein
MSSQTANQISTAIAGYDVDSFVSGYVEAALWADCLPSDECVDCGYSREDHDDDAAGTLEHACGDYQIDEIGGGEHLTMDDDGLATMRAECVASIAANRADLDAYGEARTYDPSQGGVESYAGYDAWLTGHGHGAGFWDCGLGDLGDRLTEAAHLSFSEDSYPFDNGDGTASYQA